MDNGFITVHRKILTSACFADPELFKVWMWCLLRANHKEREVIHAGQVVRVGRGEFITGRHAATKELDMTPMKFRTRIALLEQMGQISRKVTNKYTVIRVEKYDDYQTVGKVLTNKQPTNNQQITTDNNVNNDNNNTAPSAEELKASQNDMSWKERRYSDDFELEPIQADPDYKPKSSEKKKVEDEVQQVFDLFSNPAKVTWRLREIERVAAKALFDTYGLETLKKRIERIEAEKKVNGNDPYFPLVNTPSTLLDKMEAVERYLKI